MLKLNLKQNTVAHVIMEVPGRMHADDVVRKLQWLPLKYRMNFKIATLMFKAKSTLLFHMAQQLPDRLRFVTDETFYSNTTLRTSIVSKVARIGDRKDP